jgi:superfamily II DNA/RNA helicase
LNLQRKKIIDIFQENTEIRVFLSTDAGGVGVNLQTANVLINLDLPWNPAVLEQRIGRIYRLGQKKHVNIFNFIANKSIEHRIHYLLDFKRSVFKGVIEEEGQDSVMLESFLESVKALTAVNLEEGQDEEIGSGLTKRRTIDNMADQKNKKVLKEFKSSKAIVSSTQDARTQPNRNISKDHKKEKTGLFSRFKNMLKKLLKNNSDFFLLNFIYPAKR